MYRQSPQVVLTYPSYLEAYNTDRWTGWTRVLEGRGPAFYTSGNTDTYLKLQPRTGGSSGGARGLWLVIGVLVVLVVAGLIALVRRRGRAAALETE